MTPAAAAVLSVSSAAAAEDMTGRKSQISDFRFWWNSFLMMDIN